MHRFAQPNLSMPSWRGLLKKSFPLSGFRRVGWGWLMSGIAVQQWSATARDCLSQTCKLNSTQTHIARETDSDCQRAYRLKVLLESQSGFSKWKGILQKIETGNVCPRSKHTSWQIWGMGPRGVCPKKNKIPVSFFLKKSWCWLQLPWTRFRVVSSAAPVKSGRDCINRGADMSRERDSVCRWCSAAPPAIMHKLVSAIFTGEGTCVYKLAFRKNTSYGHIYILYSVSICRSSGFCIPGCTAHLLAVKYCCRPKQTDVQVSQLQKSINHKISW